MPLIVALRDEANPRTLVEMEIFDDSPAGAQRAQESASQIREEYDLSDYKLYRETATSVERFLSLKQVHDWPEHVDV
jgi:hypothetical protein